MRKVASVLKKNMGSFVIAKLQAKRRSLFAIALIVTAIIPVYTQQYDSERDFQIDYDPNVKEGVIITKYIGSKKEVNIPPSIQNNPVTGIGKEVFRGNRNITKVTIPNGVKSIGESVFVGCTSLASITIPDSLTSIGKHAFEECTSLASVTIPNSVTSIGEGVFFKCIKLTSVIIPNSVTTLEIGTFASCTGLTSVTIPDNVTSIGNWVFESCTNLTSVTFQGTITAGNFGSDVFGKSGDNGYIGDLRAKYLANDGGPGTYTRFANGGVWRKR